MNDKTGGNRGLRRAGALAAVAAVAVLATACGGSSAPSAASSALAGSATFAQELALAQCMRSHGVPSFPDPSASGGFNLTTTPNGPRGAIDIDSSQVQAGYGACRHLLPGGGMSLAQLQQQAQKEQQEEQKELPALLKFSQCIRSHGVPNFPDPAVSGQGTPAPPEGAGISPKSPQFQAAVSACQHVLPAGAHLSVGAHTSSGTPG
jgi:hypothetical protein